MKAMNYTVQNRKKNTGTKYRHLNTVQVQNIRRNSFYKVGKFQLIVFIERQDP